MENGIKGYNGAFTFNDTERLDPFFRSIRLYSLNQKKFTEYTLINPIIKSYKFGDHSTSSTDFNEIEMTLEFETVLLREGKIAVGNSDSEVEGFAELHYDKGPSPLVPLGGGTQSVTGKGGFLDAVNAIKNGGLSGASALTALRLANNLNGQNLIKMAGGELLAAGQNIIANNPNPLSGMFVPVAAPAVNTADNYTGDGIITGNVTNIV